MIITNYVTCDRCRNADAIFKKAREILRMRPGEGLLDKLAEVTGRLHHYEDECASGDSWPLSDDEWTLVANDEVVMSVESFHKITRKCQELRDGVKP